MQWQKRKMQNCKYKKQKSSNIIDVDHGFRFTPYFFFTFIIFLNVSVVKLLFYLK